MNMSWNRVVFIASIGTVLACAPSESVRKNGRAAAPSEATAESESSLSARENERGLDLLQKKLSKLAIPHFEKAIQACPTGNSAKNYYQYNLATAQYESGALDDASKTLSEIDPSVLDRANQLKVCFLKANIYDKKGLPLETLRQLLIAGRFLSPTDPAENRATFDRFFEKSLQNSTDVEALQRIYQDFEDSPVADALLFRLSALEANAGLRVSQESHLRILLSRFPNSSYYSKANEILTDLVQKSKIDPLAIGVLLPMSGKFAKYGNKTLQALEMAFGIFGSDSSSSKYRLIIENSGDEPEQAINALTQLVTKHHVIAVIGPLLSKGVDQVSQKAQEFGIPMISLSRRAGPPLDYVIQGGMTQTLQAYELARFAIQQLQLKSFAMIYPNDKMGAEISQSFWDAVESFGGKIVGAESYNPGETDFRQPVDKLSGLYYTAARNRELEQLAKDRDQNNIKKKTRKTEQFYNLKPIVDYEAVFIPDEATVAGQIIPTFAYRDVEKVKFLGTSEWNSADFINRTQTYAENATFVEAFFPESASSLATDFIGKYKTTFGQDPTSIEALAYDAGRILKNALGSSSVKSRMRLLEELRSVHNFPGVTGKISYRAGQLYRNLKVITVRNGKFVADN